VSQIKKSPYLAATLAAAVCLLFALFMPWQDFLFSSESGFSGWGVAAAIFTGFVAIECAFQLGGTVKKIPVPPAILVLLPALIAAITTALKFLVDADGRTTWAWVGLVSAIALVVFAFVNALALIRMGIQMRKMMKAHKATLAQQSKPEATEK
jgi:hypothetical protein